MNKADVTREVAGKLGLTQVKAAETIEVVMSTLMDGAHADGKVIYTPWKFVKKVTEARKGRNPKTGESIDIPRKVKVVFKDLRD